MNEVSILVDWNKRIPQPFEHALATLVFVLILMFLVYLWAIPLWLGIYERTKGAE